MQADSDEPLVQVTNGFIVDAVPNISPTVLRELEELVGGYLGKQLDYFYVAGLLYSRIGTTKPIEKLRMILTVSEKPLPAISDLPIEAQNYLLRKKSRPWTEYEDVRLLAGIHKFGLNGWGSIAQFVGNSRTKAQCCQRWARGLDPRISKINWTPQEDMKLQSLVAQYGQKAWTKIASEFGNRCDAQCRYRFKQLSECRCDFVPAIAPARPKLPSIQSLLSEALGAPRCFI
jgi:hypothetical protein